MISRAATNTYYFIFSHLGCIRSLHAATEEGNLGKVRDLLDKCVAVDTLNLENNQTALHVAADKGFLEIAKLLLARGANPTAFDRNSETPLHFAVRAENAALIKILVLNYKVPVTDASLNSPLALASAIGSLEMLRLLESLGAKVDEKTLEKTKMNKQKKEALNWCKERGVETGCNGQFSILNAHVKSGDSALVEGMLSFPYFKDSINTTFYDLTLNNNIKVHFPSIFKRFENNAYEINGGVSYFEEVANTHKATVLFQAILNFDVDMTILLVQSGADVTLSVNGMTPRELAQELRNTDILNILNNLSQVDDNKFSPKQRTI